MLTKQQLYKAFCLICPNRYPTSGKPCQKQNATCKGQFKDDFLKRKKYLKEATYICYWLYYEDSEIFRHFKLKK